MTRPICYIEDCSRPHHAQGLCKMHYTRQRKMAVKKGVWETVQVDATPFKDRIREFLDAGYNSTMLQALTGIERKTMLRALSKDRRTVLADNIEKLERLPIVPLYRLWKTDIGIDYDVPSYLAIRRIRALLSMGWTSTLIAEATSSEDTSGVSRQTITRLAHANNTDFVPRSTLLKVDHAYDALSMTEPPMPYRHSELTRYRHWPMPLEWDDDTIDLPGAEVEAEALAAARVESKRRSIYNKKRRALASASS